MLSKCLFLTFDLCGPFSTQVNHLQAQFSTIVLTIELLLVIYCIRIVADQCLNPRFGRSQFPELGNSDPSFTAFRKFCGNFQSENE